ncbi:MBOAT family O-acyltransferase [Clostridium paraputrificum]|uniref:MBOAT family O-acyltransferase n=1 Tax=Clostridium paraputrificum TaxID=29363 RepID=UPI00189DE101|nr:MBOAT family protein [Clostridium paraputrificum]MDB2117420.1 MBOAT family protein [Clostridium paraputrificum]
MIFSSILFIFRFLPIALILYYITPQKYKNLILTLLSLVFYSWGEGKYFLIMIASIIIDYTAGRLIYRYKNEIKKKTIVLCISLVFNLGLLFFFKYFNFFIDNINNIFNLAIKGVKITLPLGISFYTFQTMSYSIDVYRGKVVPEKNIINFAAFVTLFPQLIAGPIVKYTDINKEISRRVITKDNVEVGIEKFILGLGRKVLIANNIGMLWTEVEGIGFENISTPLAWLGIISFGLQIYFDFSGYSLMAIGLGKMLGFNFPENFNYPYISRSISEFWRRWHITLGSWFKEYVYIPLGGNRKGKVRVTFNLFIVWALTGLWHGASYNFLLWGLFFFLLISIEKLGLINFLNKHRVFSHIYTIFLLLIGWTLFAITDFNGICEYLSKLFFYSNGEEWIYYLRNYGVSLIIAIIFSLPLVSMFYKKIENFKWIKTIILMGIFIISVAYLVDATYNPFLYFRF